MDSRLHDHQFKSPKHILSSPTHPNMIYSPQRIIHSPLQSIQPINYRFLSPSAGPLSYQNKITSPVQSINLANSQMFFSPPSILQQTKSNFLSSPPAPSDNDLEHRFLNCVNRSKDLLSAYGYSINGKSEYINLDINEMYDMALKRSQETLVRYSEAIDKKDARREEETHIARAIFEFQPNENFLYDGEINNGRRHGYGVLKNEEGGEVYAGEWVNDELCGKGRLRNMNPEGLEQQYNHKNFDELGNFWIYYEGDFKGNLFHGMGDLLLSNEEKFVGKFEQGIIHGEGCFYRLNGDMELGLWENNRLVKDL